MSITFVYTLSSVDDLVTQTVRSIRTLKTYVAGDQINVYFTPPIEDDDVELINELNVNTIRTSEVTEPFNIQRISAPRGYGEKIHCCEVGTEQAVFLDCDTLILDDIWKVIEGDFDIKAKPWAVGVQQPQWRQMFEDHGQTYMDWMPNTGFIIFKNNTHSKIRDDWLHYLNQDLDAQFNSINLLDQRALAMAAGEYSWSKMSTREHYVEWMDEPRSDAVVQHLATDNTLSLNQLVSSPLRTIKSIITDRIRN